MDRDGMRAALDAVRKVQKNSDALADALNLRFRALEHTLREASVRVPASVLVLGHPDADQEGWTLSWGKFKNRWSLLIEKVHNWTDDERIYTSESIPVTDAELRLRKFAVPHCAELVTRLGRLATAQTEELQRANRMMDELLDAIGVDLKAVVDPKAPVEPDPWGDDEEIPF